MPHGTEAILVIDDERIILTVIRSMLSQYGYDVLTASSGAEALALLRDWPELEINLLLVDLVMPDMSGEEAVDRIHEVRPDIPVVYCSGFSERARPLVDKGIPFITKPFTAVQLASKIRAALDAGSG